MKQELIEAMRVGSAEETSVESRESRIEETREARAENRESRVEETREARAERRESRVEETREARVESRESRVEETREASVENRESRVEETGEARAERRETGAEGAQEAAALLRQRAAAHLDSLYAQAEELRREFPDFDLEAALRDRDFLRLTAPGLGVDLRRAYYALHREELDGRVARQAAEETRRQVARSLRSGEGRPREGGGRQAAASLAADYRSLSRSQQLQLKQRILEASARGEKLYPV